MPNLLASLSSAGNALDVFQQALTVIQNNVNNSSTPGYASQTLNITAQPFDVASGAAGGIAAAVPQPGLGQAVARSSLGAI